MAFDYHSNIVVADTINNCINIYQYKKNKIGTLLKTFGSFGSGNDQFNNPSSVAFAFNADTIIIIIADTLNNRIQILRYSDFSHIRTIEGTQLGITNFENPICVLLDYDNNIIVRCDGDYSGICVFRISDGKFLRRVGMIGDYKGKGNIKFARDDLVFVDSLNHRIDVINYNDGTLIRRIGNGKGDWYDEFYCPLDIDFIVDDDKFHIVVADLQNSRVQILDYDSGAHLKIYAKLKPIGILVDIEQVIIINNDNNIITMRPFVDDTDITYDNSRNKSIVCQNETSYFPFLENCLNSTPILSDIDEKAKTNPEMLCVEPWYKKKYSEKYDKKILALDFDHTLTDIEIKDDEADTINLDIIFKNKLEFIEILKIAWEKIVTIYIISRRQKDIILKILNRFYIAENITFHQIYEINILGRPNTFVYPSSFNETEKNIFWANEKVKYLEDICIIEKVKKSDILFCDDYKLNIDTAKKSDFINSIFIDKKLNAIQVLSEFKKFIFSVSNYQQKYLKYKKKYLTLKNQN